MSTRDGLSELKAAQVEAADQAEPEQLSMLVPMARPGEVLKDPLASIARRARGRPKGAENLTGRDFRAWFVAKFGDPLVERARFALHTPQTLAAELGCTVLEAFDRLDKIHADLARYFHAPRAAEDGEGKAVAPALMFAFGHHGAVIGGGDEPPWEQLVALQQNQALGAADAEPSKTIDVENEQKP